jgi:uncharacterized protein (DUF3820 family)
MPNNALSDNSPMPFGKYQGTPMANVPAKYLLWLYRNGLETGSVLTYIIDNLDGLKQEAGEPR